MPRKMFKCENVAFFPKISHFPCFNLRNFRRKSSNQHWSTSNQPVCEVTTKNATVFFASYFFQPTKKNYQGSSSKKGEKLHQQQKKVTELFKRHCTLQSAHSKSLKMTNFLDSTSIKVLYTHYNKSVKELKKGLKRKQHHLLDLGATLSFRL